MKKTTRTARKVLSVFLSVLMILTTLTVAAPGLALAADGNKYYVKVYVNIYDGSDGYGNAYTVDESTGKPKNYSWATNDGWYGRINMTGFTVFGEGGDYDAQDVSAALLEAEELNTYYAMSGLSDNNQDGDWDSKAIAQKEYTFTLDSFPVEVFWMNDENNWDGGNTGFAIRKLTVATSEGGTEHTMWEGLAGSDSETYNYYGSITPTGIHTCFEDYAKNYDMDDYKFYKSITTSSQRAWADPYSAGTAGTYYLNDYQSGGVSATFSEGVASVASNVYYIDTSSTNTYYINFTNHSKTQNATIVALNNGNKVEGYADNSIVIKPGETVSKKITNISSLGKDNQLVSFCYRYTLENVYASDALNAGLAEFYQPCYIGTWYTSDDAREIADQNGDGYPGFLMKQDEMHLYNQFQADYGIFEVVSQNEEANGSGSFIHTDFTYNYYLDNTETQFTTWEQTGFRMKAVKTGVTTRRLHLQPDGYGTLGIQGNISNSDASISMADMVLSYNGPSDSFTYPSTTNRPWAYINNPCNPQWDGQSSNLYATLWDNSVTAWFRFCGTLFKNNGTSSNAGQIVFNSMQWRKPWILGSTTVRNVTFSGDINVQVFDKSELFSYVRDTLLDFAPMGGTSDTHSSRYNKTKFSAYETALSNAMSVLANQKTTQYAVNNALASLKSAVEALQTNANLVNQIDSLKHIQYVGGIGSEIAAQTDARYVLIPLGEHTVPEKAEYIGNGTFNDKTNKKSNLVTNYTKDDTEIDYLNYYYWNIDYTQITPTIELVEDALNNFDSDTYSSTLKTALGNAKEQLEAIDQTTTGDNTPTSQEDVDNVIKAANDLLAHMDEGYEHCDYDANDDGTDDLKTKESTCAEAGYTYYKCNICGKVQKVEDLELAEHSWDAGTETTAPECGKAGVMTYTCLVCNETKTEATTEIGTHDFQISDNGDGTHISKCSKCGAEEPDAVAEAHTYNYTINADGTHTATCSVCNATVTAAHSFTKSVLTRPTQNTDGTWTDGYYTRTCVCGATKTEPAVRADYSELENAVAELEALESNENLTDEEKAVIADALADADNLADDLVTAEQDKIDALVKELKDIKADADEAIKNKELGVNDITEATSGVKVQFIDASGLGTIDSVQLDEDEGFIIRVTNGNADSSITVTGVQGTGIDATADKKLASGESADYGVTAPTASGIYEYAITYTIDGLKDAEGNPVEATTKAYLYVKDEAYQPYHYLHEEAWQGQDLALDYYVEATYGDFTLNNPTGAEQFNDNMLVNEVSTWRFDKYDYGTTCYDESCDATAGTFSKSDAHLATYNYYVDTSIVKTWEDAGFRTRFVETAASNYDKVNLKYLRLAVNQEYLDGISDGDKTFTVAFVPSASGSAGKTDLTFTSTGTLEILHVEEPYQDVLLFGSRKANGTNNTAYANFSGTIPAGVNADGTTPAKFMFAPKLRMTGSLAADEASYMTTHIWLTSYDKAALREAVANAETAGYNSAYFNEATYEAYENALAAAKEVLGKAETNQNEVDKATEALKDAIAALEANDAEAKFVLTVTHSIRDGKDMSFDATHTVYDYYLANGDVTPDYTDLTDKKINKYDDKATIEVTEDKTHTYNYWYIDYSKVQDAIDAADEILKNSDDYSEDYINNVTEKKEALEDILAGESTTTEPASQDVVDDAIDAVTNLTGHEHVSGAVVTENIVPATCKADGSHDEVTYCTTCGKQLSRETITDNKLPHTEKVLAAVAATCTTTGLTEGKECSVCGETIVAQTVTNALGHNFSATVTANEATCEAPGNVAYKQCTVCQLYFAADAETDSKDGKTDTATFTIAQLAHSYTGDYVWYNNAEPKTHAQLCVNGCGKANPETTECTFETTTEAPTCTEGGKTIYTCSVCNNSYYTSIAANGHTWDKTTEEFFEDATSVAGKVGYYSYKCSVENCDGELKIYVEAAEYDALDNLVAELKEIIANNDLTDEAKKEVQDAIDKAEALPDNLTKPATDEESGITTPDGQSQIDALVAELTDIKTEVNTGIADGSLVKPNSDAAEKAVEAAEGLKETVENLPQEDADAIDDLREQLNEILDEIEADDNPTDAEYQDRLDAIEEAAKDIVEKYADCSEGHAWKEIGFARPTQNDDGTWNNGTYTYECENCGTTKTEPAVRATYTEYDNAKAALESLKGNAAITAEAKSEIEKVLADNSIDNNLVAAEQSIVDAAANALKAVLGELTDENGTLKDEYKKVDFTNYNAAVNAAEALKDVMTDEDKAAVEAAKKTVTDAGITEETSKADGQKTLDDAAAAIAAINAKYGDCANGNHNWGTPELTKKPTADEQGEYTETCGTCGTTQITKVDLADYSKLDAAVKALEELAKTENLTDEAKTAIEDALEKAENLDKNLPADATTADGKHIEGGQDEIDALVEQLQKVVADTNAAIADGSALEPDYTEWDKAETAYDALDKTNVKDEIIAEADALKAEIAAKEADDTLTQATATQQDINNATTRLNEIITEINGILTEKPDYSGYEASREAYDALVNQYGDKIKDSVAGDVAGLDAIVDGVRNDETATKVDDQPTVDNAKTQLDAIIEGIKDGSLIKDADFTNVKKDLADAKDKAENNNVIDGVKESITNIENAINALENDPATNATSQDVIDALEKQLEAIIEGIKDGTLVKPDLTDAEADLADAKDKAEKNDVIDGVDTAIENLENALDDIENDGTATKADDQDDVEAIEKALEDIIAGIEDGSLVKPDYDDAEQAITNAESTGSMTDADKEALEDLKKELEDLKKDPTTNKKDDQTAVNEIKDAVQTIVDKYADCENGNHNWGEPELTTAPTADAQGEYTETCGICGATQITKVDLANYDAFDDAVDALEDLLDTENLTAEAKQNIEAALEKAENLDKNLPADVTTVDGKEIKGGQDKINALVAELEKVVADTNAGIADGSLIKPDYTEVDKDLADAKDKAENNDVIDGVKDNIKDIEDKLNEIKKDPTSNYQEDQDDVDALEKQLEDIIAGIEDGSLVKPDYTEAENAVKEAEKDLNGGKLSDEDQKALDELKDKLEDLKNDPTTNKKNNQDDVNGIRDAAQEIVNRYSECAKGNHAYETETVLPTCTEKGYDLHTCKVCGKTYKDNYVDETGHIEVVLEAVEPTCSSVGLTEGKKCEKCGTITVAQEEIPMLRHTDADGDGVCDVCGKGGLYDGCTCLCHNNHWFWRLVYLIIRIIWRVFRIHQICPCGAVHF